MSERHRILRQCSHFLASILLMCVGAATLVSASSQSLATDPEGKAFDPFRAAQGKVVVLIFVRTDCPISNRYAPIIQRLSAQNEGKAAFFLVYPDKKETTDSIRKHSLDFGYTFAALRDPQHI